jgi:ketosteroid isomerase-like protein
MGEASIFMRPVKVFPFVETILHCSDWMRQSLVVYYRSLLPQVLRLPNPPRLPAFPSGLRLRPTIVAGFSIVALTIPSTALGAVTDVAQIQSVLTTQQAAWNRGDIDAFMNGYARSPSTAFISEDQIRHGWETVRNRYRAKYSDRAKMGKLTFSEIQITPLSPDAAVVLGRWSLQRVKDRPHGRFTLIFRRLPEGWRITLDHTSAASAPK